MPYSGRPDTSDRVEKTKGSEGVESCAAVGAGSTGNVIAALLSFLLPGLGQLCQGRWLMAAAALFSVLSAVQVHAVLGVVVWLCWVVDAATWTPPWVVRVASSRDPTETSLKQVFGALLVVLIGVTTMILISLG